MEVGAAFEDARVLVTRGLTEEARAAVDAILEGDPQHLGALLLKGELLLDAREGDEARQAFKRATQVWPRSSEAWNGLARCLHALGDDGGALAAAEEAQRLLPEGDNVRHAPAVSLTIVWCLRELRRYREALAVAEEALARTPDAVLAHWAGVVEEELEEAERERC